MFKSAIKRNNLLYLAIFVISLSGLTASIILYASSKVIVAFSLLPILMIFYLNAPHFAKIVFPMIMITFPITLQVLGKDAFSTGTLIILITFAWSLTKYRIEATIAKDKFLFKLLFLMGCIAFIGMVTQTPQAYWGPAVRHYLNFISSIAVFILIIHSQHIGGVADNKQDYIEKIISALLLITVMHVFLSLLILNFPWVEKYFAVFLNRTQENLGGKTFAGSYVRAATVFTRAEEFGELLALLFPFALYKVFTSKKKLYFFVTASLLFGTLISGTRSAFLLIIFQILVFVFILLPQKYNKKRIIVTVAFISSGLLMLPVISKYAPMLMNRLQVTLEKVEGNEGIATVVNRLGLWKPAYALTINTISLFGHGPLQANILGFPVYNFHCLYLSLLFQFGIVGSIVFLMFFFTLAKRLWKSAKKIKGKGPDYLSIITCLLSLFCFLINEIKYEFNRGDSYQQFVWCIFGIYYLTGTLSRNDSVEKK